ncbi:MAG TPA: TMEM175 family protein [Vicinamibacterales bacterium]|nr:TMEM175 family protein [Vicinamibacterales bacterium]
MTKTRLEAFSDGVIAILITIMVLELKVPEESPDSSLHMLTHRWPIFLSYVLSFVFLGIYWANHHHLLHTVTRVTGGMLWANLHLLFWLSLVPFTTHWMGGTSFARWPTAVYGIVLVACAMAWLILQSLIVRTHGPESALKQAVGDDWKGKFSVITYVAAILVAIFSYPHVALGLYALVAMTWLVPDRRIERQLHHD